MSLFRRLARARPLDVETLVIVLTASMLEWLRVLPAWRAQHMLKLTATLLRKHNERAWSGRLDSLAGRLRAAQDSPGGGRLVDAMHEILSCFGGMGSLSDLYLSPHNGHKIKTGEVDAVNARLGALRTQLYLSARQTIARAEWQRRQAG
jgi:hypothetical protein